MTVTEPMPKVIHADREHGGIRIGVLLVLSFGFLLAFIILNVLFGNLPSGLLADFSLGFSCGGALLISLAIAAIAEKFMKRYWSSGRHVTIEKEGLRAKLPEGEEVAIRWLERATALHWHFQMSGYPKAGRERRVPSSYFCLACQVRQGGQFLILYSFMSKKNAQRLLAQNEYAQIVPGQYYDVGLYQRIRGSLERPEIPSEVLLGDLGPYWLAEKRRWTEGLELESKDFGQIVSIISEHIQE